MPGLAVIETHPIQYHAPVWRELQARHGIPVTAIYGSDFSVAGYYDREFGARLKWETDILLGYESVFLSRTKTGGARDDSEVTVCGLSSALQEIKPAAVVCVGYSPRFHTDAFRTVRGASLPILFRGETTDHAQCRGRVKRLIRDNALRFLYKRCAALLHVGERSKAHFFRLGFRATRFSPYCVDTGHFQTSETARRNLRDVTRAELDLEPHQFVIAFCGKLSHRKAPDVLVAGVASLPEPERNRSVLLLIGDGELRDELVIAARAAGVRLQIVGFQAQHQLGRYYHASDLLVLPSRFGETWGLVVNEALHHGIPVVASDGVGCAPDLLVAGITGEIFESESARGLRDAILRARHLGRTPESREMCRRKVAAYSVSSAAAGLAESFEEVTALGSARAR